MEGNRKSRHNFTDAKLFGFSKWDAITQNTWQVQILGFHDVIITFKIIIQAQFQVLSQTWVRAYKLYVKIA